MVTVYTNKNNYRYSIVVRKKKIIEKEMTVYQNNSVDIKVDASVKVKEINRSNKNISIKEKSGNTYTILPKKVGKSVVTIQTNRSIYKYEISIKNQPGLNSSMLSDYIKKKNPRKIIFTNKVKNNKTTDLSMQGNKAVVGWMDKDTLYIGSKHGAYVDCYDASFLFFDLPNIEYIDVTYLNTAPSQSAESMFGSCPRLKEIKGLNTLNFSNVRNMSGMFAACYELQELDVTGWNTSKVRTMSYMFYCCKQLETIRGLETWNTGNVWNMSCMFSYGISYSHDGPLKNINLSNLNVSNVRDMSDMFYGCGSLKYIDVSKWDVSNLRTADHMFCQCISLENLDVSNWNVENVNNFNAMFHSCRLLKYIDVSKWNTRSAIYMCQMFEACSSLIEIDVSHFITNKVIGFGEMFKDCISLQELNLTSFCTEAVPNGAAQKGTGDYARCSTGFDGMFRNSGNLKRIYVGDKWNIENKSSEFFFLYCGTNFFMRMSAMHNLKAAGL